VARPVFHPSHILRITIFALVVVRLFWRARRNAPPLSRSLPRGMRGAAHASHWLLYLVLILMQVSG